ncbi:MAG: radical SAM protein [Candidatus Thermoplasmatota archaeon]|nr:radical SAM protein [Candidatus Thermoplasmatota archaeon]
MDYRLFNCDSLIKKITKKDNLFHGTFCVDPYENCEFGCQYCDSSFEKTVYVKKNSIEVLKKELQLMKKGRVIIGSVYDPYQNAEKKFNLTRSILETLKKNNYSCHILTKSPLVLRDVDLIADLDCLVTISISSLDNHVVQIFEPAVPSPVDRLRTIKELRKQDINAGIAVIPILPYITEIELENLVSAAQKVEARYVLHKYLELKGDQKQYVRNLIKIHYPHLLSKYDTLYENNFSPGSKYIQQLNDTLSKYCKEYNISDKIII